MNKTHHTARDLSARIPGSYYERIMEARLHEGREEWDEAAQIYQRIIDRISRLPEQRRRPDSEVAAYLVAAAIGLQDVRALQGDFEGATQLCEQLQVWDAEDADSWRQRIHVLRIEMGEVDQGLQSLLSLAESEPEKFDHWIVLAREAIESRRLEMAETALQRAEEMLWETGDEDAAAIFYFDRFHLRRLQHRWREAAEAWDAAVNFDETLGESSEVVVRMFLEAGLWDDAERYADEESLGVATATFYQGFIAYRRGDRVRARSLWRQVAETNLEEHPDAIVAVALARCWLGQPMEGLMALLLEVQLSRELAPQEAITLGLGWAMQGNREAARTNLELAVRSFSSGRKRRLLAPLDWYSFEQLVQDAALKDELRQYFDLSEHAAP